MLTQTPSRTLFSRLFARGAAPRPIDPPVSSIVAPPTVTWPDPVKSIRVGMTCPNCRSRARKPIKLTVNFATPDHPMRHSRVLSCPDCTCLFYEDQNPPDYTEESMLGRGRTAFYLQQGAGVSLITRPLATIDRPAGSRYLEVGCGFGFGLDFALQAKRWDGTGIDPAGLSALGRDLLGVPIELRYLGDDEPAFTGTCDVVMASETIEHVPSPLAFLRTLKRALKPGGILILTTPNAAEIDYTKSQAVLVPLLSPGLHLVFQNADSLRHLLTTVGFTHIVQETDATSLVAFASDAPFERRTEPAALRAVYRAYLEDRARAFPPESDMLFAFAGRALQESSNDADWARAERVYAILRDACRVRFRLDLDTLAELPAEASSCSLERLCELMPLNLGGILYADAMRCLAVGAPPRATLGPRLACAADAADAMRRALGELAMEDGMSETVGWAARAEGLLCDAAAGRPDIGAQLAGLAPAPPGGETGAARRGEIVERALAWAVNAGHVAVGRTLAETTGLQSAKWANPAGDDVAPPPLPPSRRDALFCLAVLDTQMDGSGDLQRGRRRFQALRLMLQAHGLRGASIDLPGHVVRGELQALGLLDDEPEQLRVIREALASLSDLPERDTADLRQRAVDTAQHLADLAQHRADEATQRQNALILALVAHVNAGEHNQARAHEAELRAESFVVDTDLTLTAAQVDALFALGVLHVQEGGDPAAAQAWFARVRHALARAEGAGRPDLLWAAMRGEVQAVHMQSDAATADQHRHAMLAALALPDAVVPADLRRPVGTG